MQKMLWTITSKEIIRTNKNSYYQCKCICGKESLVRMGNYGKESFGCRLCCVKRSSTTHGDAGTVLYRVFSTMHDRCYLKSCKSFKAYGARGIIVSEIWHKYENFRDWANENGYKKGLSIDRIDFNGNYDPLNCKWSTAREQAQNKRNNRNFTINGVTYCLSEWARKFDIKREVERNFKNFTRF